MAGQNVASSSKVTSELAAVRRRMEVEERSKLAAEERYEKLKVAEARRLGEVSALKLELVEVREALRASEAKAESLARELEEEGDEAVPPIELLIEDQEGGEALITEEATVTQPSPLPRSVIESPGVVSLYSTPGGLANSSVKRRRRLRRVSALLLDAAVTLQHSGAMGELKDQVFNITAQLVESIAQQRCAQEERDSACVRLADVQMQLAEERERMEELKAEVNTKARESMISSGRAAVAEGMLRELAEDRQREKLSLLAEIASLRSTLLENEATAAQSAASARVGMQEARERIRVLETRLGMQDNSFAAMVEQCTKWKAQNEHLQSQVSARELELDSVRASLREWKGRAAELSDDLVRAGDSLVNTEASMLDLQFKVSFYETLYTQKEASVIVARACVVGLSRAAMVAAEEEKAREAALRAAEILSSRAEVARTKEEAAAHLAATLEYMQHEKEELEALIRETQEETYQLRNGIEELDKERESMGEELRITRERMAEREAEVEVLRATGLSAEQRQCLEGEIEGANKTLREALGDLASTRADLETAAKEVARCHKIMERFDMEAITSGTASNANSGGNRLSQSRRVSYVQHLRHEINNLYEENKRLRNERQALEAQLLMGTRRSPAGQNTPSPGGSNSFTPRRTPRKGPVPPRTPKTPMGMAAAELARRKREAEEMKINERHRQRFSLRLLYDLRES
ncbi:hypothetical protein FOL46_009794 [Perkinsus olseni]|uniref:Uncharacterized protein n=1 Tax=Perkinsus olseni TaxID=32597 RepID=A0A7J6MK73_PEROL|nr:hypothetical protein FOL46_009794 [Perkinsus olseni]